MRFWRGDYQALFDAKGKAFAEAFGERGVPSVYKMDLINETIIAQSEQYPEQFDRAMRDRDPHTALMREAVALDIPFWTLAYGMSVAVATSFTILEERGLDAVLRLGDIEDHVVHQLAEFSDRSLHAASFDKAAVRDAPTGYILRSTLCERVTTNPYAYVLMLAGVPIADTVLEPTETKAMLDAVILGAPVEYAVYAAKRTADAQLIAECYRENVSLEYLGALGTGR